MENFHLQIKCSICDKTEVVTSNNYKAAIHELINQAYQLDNSRIDPLFKFPIKVISGDKGETNWEHFPLCEQCRANWEVLKQSIGQQINTFKSG